MRSQQQENSKYLSISIFQAPSKLSVSYKNIRGSEEKLEKLEALDSKTSSSGVAIIKYDLGGCLTKEIGLHLHFQAKWILLSEVHFSSETVNSEYLENTLNEQPTDSTNEDTDTEMVEKISVQQDEKIPVNQDEEDDGVGGDDTNSAVPVTNTDSVSQMYVGITIGILGMSVLLLLFTIFFMLRKNKHRIFSKHSSK